MDFSFDNLSSNLSNVYNNASNAESTKLSNKISSADYSKATDEELMDVCKEFEAYFLEQVFKEMSSSVNLTGTEDSQSSQMVDFFKDKAIQELATQSTDSQSMGIAKMLYESMKREYNI